MSAKNDGGPAFPRPDVLTSEHTVNIHEFGNAGMTLRDYFAAKAMVSESLSMVVLRDEPGFREKLAEVIQSGRSLAQHVAEHAYDLADAMIAAREKKGGAK